MKTVPAPHKSITYVTIETTVSKVVPLIIILTRSMVDNRVLLHDLVIEYAFFTQISWVRFPVGAVLIFVSE